MNRVAKLVALFSTGILAGAFTAAFFTVVPAWYEVPRDVHFTYRVALMRHNSVFMQAMMVVSILTPLWWAWLLRPFPAARNCAILASVMAITCLLVTRFGNVPINGEIRTWLNSPPPANYQDRLHVWTVFHDIRTAAAALSFLLILVADALLDAAHGAL